MGRLGVEGLGIRKTTTLNPWRLVLRADREGGIQKKEKAQDPKTLKP